MGYDPNYRERTRSWNYQKAVKTLHHMKQVVAKTHAEQFNSEGLVTTHSAIEFRIGGDMPCAVCGRILYPLTLLLRAEESNCYEIKIYVRANHDDARKLTEPEAVALICSNYDNIPTCATHKQKHNSACACRSPV